MAEVKTIGLYLTEEQSFVGRLKGQKEEKTKFQLNISTLEAVECFSLEGGLRDGVWEET